MGGSPSPDRGPAAERALELFASITGADDVARADAFTSSFVLKTIDGRIVPAPSAGEPLPAELARLAEVVLNGHLEEPGGGYVLAGEQGVGESPGVSTWAIRLHSGRLAAAFEFEARKRAVEAVPDRYQPRSDVLLAEDSVWAFVQRDVATVLKVLHPDFTYTDHQTGANLSGASEAINALLLAHSDLAERGVSGLELRSIGEGLVEGTGVLTREDPDGSTSSWRWTVNWGIEDGLIAWAVAAAGRTALRVTAWRSCQSTLWPPVSNTERLTLGADKA